MSFPLPAAFLRASRTRCAPPDGILSYEIQHSGDGDESETLVQRYSAQWRASHRQLFRCSRQLGGAPAHARLHTLRRRLPRHDDRIRPCDDVRTRSRMRSRVHRERARPGEVHDLRAVGRAGAHGTGMDIQHRDGYGAPAEHDPVQGEVRAAPREHQRGAADVSHSPGGGHPDLQGRGRPRRRRPAPALGAEPGNRATLQQPVRRGDVPRAEADALQGAAHHGPRRRQQDVQEPRQHRRHLRRAGCGVGAAAHRVHRPGPSAAQGPGQPRHLQHIHAARAGLAAGPHRGDRRCVSEGGDRLHRVQEAAQRAPQRDAGADQGARQGTRGAPGPRRERA